MRYIKLSLLLIVSFAVFSTAVAQRSQTSIQYVIGFPMGDLKDYIGSTSFRGVAVDFRTMVHPKLAVGFDAGVNVFYERKDYDTYVDGTASLSGVQYRYTNAFPLHATVAYYPNNEKSFSPFIGLGAGTVYNKRDTDIGMWEISTDEWQFSLKPEVGFINKFSPNFGLKVAAKYFANFKSNGLEGQSFIALGVGIVFLK